MKSNDPPEELRREMELLELSTVHGRITEVVGMLIRAIVPQVKIGDVCLVQREGTPLMTQVVGFAKGDEVFLSPLGEMDGIGPSSEVIPIRGPLMVRVGDALKGRVLDALGNPLDVEEKGELILTDSYPVIGPPPNPLTRRIIDSPLETGVRCIDGTLAVGEGQRMGIFAAAGGGKSTLLGMIARYAVADVNVIALIGERGRELKEFLEHDLGEEGRARSVIIVSTSDQASQLRINAAYVGTAIAEYFRDQGLRVILMMDSVTRFARAIREVGLAAGEPPARAGYTPSVFSTLPKLLERSGNSDKGSITAFYTVLVAGDDMNEPVADETRSILDGHLILSSELARKNHYPAIDVLASKSRVITNILDKEHLELIGQLLEVLANYKQIELLVRIGEYQRGSDANADFAKDHVDEVNRYLRQKVEQKSTFQESLDGLRRIFR